ncbi:MAG: hypothetical protein HYU66_03180 [Armatimonadetes bacterium]|nr:hypothetical protein [Armatimonadota bacterium]
MTSKQLRLLPLALAVLWAGRGSAQQVTVEHDAVAKVQAGDVITIYVQGPAQWKATFGIGGVVRDEEMVETQPGVYEGKYTVRRTDSLNGLPVGAKLVGPNNRAIAGLANHPVGQPPPPPPATDVPVVKSFTHDAREWMTAGEVLQFAMEGTPKCSAFVSIPGALKQMALSEDKPGHYVGSWTVPDFKETILELPAGVAVGYLKGGGTIGVLEAATPIGIDNLPPRFEQMTPSRGAKVATSRPTIVVLFDVGGAGMDRDKTRVTVDGTARIPDELGRSFLRYRVPQDLAAGDHQIRVALFDIAGNSHSESWPFTVGGAVPVVRAVGQSATVKPLPGDTLTVTASGTPGLRASFSVGDRLRGLAMKEVAPGEYLGTYTVRTGEDLSGQKVSVNLVAADGQTASGEAPTPISAAQPDNVLRAPIVMEPANGAKVGATVIVRGTAKPNTRVRIQTNCRTVLGVIDLRTALPDTYATVDAQGAFASAAISLDRPLPGGTNTFTFTVTVLDGNATSPATTLAVTR